MDFKDLEERTGKTLSQEQKEQLEAIVGLINATNEEAKKQKEDASTD